MQYINRKLQNALHAFVQGRFKQAEILYLECLDKIKDKNTPAYKQALHGLSFVKMEMNELTDARELYFELLRMAQHRDNKEEEAIVFHQLGAVERLNKNFKQALRYLEQEEDIYQLIHGDVHLGLAANFYEQGMIYNELNHIAKACQFMNDALTEAEYANDSWVIGYVSRDLGDIYLKHGDEEKAMRKFRQALSVFEKVGDVDAVEHIKRKFDK